MSTHLAVREERTAVATQQESAALSAIHDPAMDFIQTLEQRWRLAKMLHASGMSRQKTPEGVMAVILKGFELGLPPMAALANIDFFDGNVQVRAHAQLAVASARFGVVCEQIESTDTACLLRLSRPGWAPVEAGFTLEEAKAAGLLGKQNWRTYPKDMLYNRALSRGIKRICPEVGAGVYDPDEVGGQRPTAATPAITPDALWEPREGDAEASPAQMQLLERLLKSHVWTVNERAQMEAALHGGGRTTVSSWIDWATEEAKTRKAAERETGEVQGDPGMFKFPGKKGGRWTGVPLKDVPTEVLGAQVDAVLKKNGGVVTPFVEAVEATLRERGELFGGTVSEAAETEEPLEDEPYDGEEPPF